MTTAPKLQSCRVLAVAVGSGALAAAWIWPLPAMARDLFSAHMFQHLLVMNVAALVIAAVVPGSAVHRGGALPTATALQLGLLWMWHVPAVFAAAHHSLVLQGLMQTSLFAAALAFWRAVLRGGERRAWRGVFALLATAKLFCLLGAVFVFSRRTLYPAAGSPEAWGLTALEDQQLAGLLMVSACALIYVAAATALFAWWLAGIDTLRRWNSSPEVAFVPR